ncbi:hypothetical protein, partial [Enterobacter intestinihominis]
KFFGLFKNCKFFFITPQKKRFFFFFFGLFGFAAVALVSPGVGGQAGGLWPGGRSQTGHKW